MSKKLAGGSIKLSDAQVRILGESMRMNLPKMIVCLSAIKAGVQVSQTAIKAWARRNGPAEINFVQNINGENVETADVYKSTKDLLKKAATDVIVDNVERAVFPQGDVVQGEKIESEVQDEEDEEEPHASDSPLPRIGMEIPEQPTRDDQA